MATSVGHVWSPPQRSWGKNATMNIINQIVQYLDFFWHEVDLHLFSQVGLGKSETTKPPPGSKEREQHNRRTGFDITVASEVSTWGFKRPNSEMHNCFPFLKFLFQLFPFTPKVMAVLALANSLQDMREKLGKYNSSMYFCGQRGIII